MKSYINVPEAKENKFRKLFLRKLSLSFLLAAAMSTVHAEYMVIAPNLNNPQSLIPKLSTVIDNPLIEFNHVNGNNQFWADLRSAYNPTNQTTLVVIENYIGMQVQLIDQYGKVSAPLPLYRTSAIDDPQVVYNPIDNEFLVTASTDNGLNLYRVTANGAPYMPKEMTDVKISDSYEVVFNESSSKYLVLWSEETGAYTNLRAEFVYRNGVPTGSPFPITNWSRWDQKPSVAVNFNNGEFLVTWNSFITEPTYSGNFQNNHDSTIYTQRLTSQGLFTGGPVPINTLEWENGYQDRPIIEYNPAYDQYLIAWARAFRASSQDNLQFQVVVRSIFANGIPVGSVNVVNSGGVLDHRLNNHYNLDLEYDKNHNAIVLGFSTPNRIQLYQLGNYGSLIAQAYEPKTRDIIFTDLGINPDTDEYLLMARKGWKSGYGLGLWFSTDKF